MSEEDNSDRYDMDVGAHKLALHIVLQSLVESASAADPDIRIRTTRAIEAYIADLKPQSAGEEDFAERARGYVATLIRPPYAAGDKRRP